MEPLGILVAITLVTGLVWVIIVRIVRRFTSTREKEGGRTTKRLLEIVSLSVQQTEYIDAASFDWDDLIKRCLESTRSTERYCSLRIFKDLNNNSLRGVDYIGLRVRADYIGPDRYHLLKAEWDGSQYAYDEWITIGAEIYQNVGLWLRVEDTSVKERNQAFGGLDQSMLTDESLDFLVRATPRRYTVLSHRGTQYAMLEYNLADIQRYKGLPVKQLNLSPDMYKVQIWFDIEHTLLRKWVLHAEGSTEKGEYEHWEEMHVFAAYDEPIKIEPPPWLNAKPDAKGQLRIVDDRIPDIRFYEE